MGKIRDKMDEDLKLRGLADGTREAYLRYAQAFVAHYRRPPTEMGREEIRGFLLHLVDERKLSASTYNVYAASVKFLYEHTLGRPEEVADIGRMKLKQKVPDILSVGEMEQVLGPPRLTEGTGGGDGGVWLGTAHQRSVQTARREHRQPVACTASSDESQAPTATSSPSPVCAQPCSSPASTADCYAPAFPS
jgi:hypothetical protein